MPQLSLSDTCLNKLKINHLFVYIADMRQRPGKSFVIVNPPPEFQLKLEDVM